jgi:TonB family protein
MTLEEEKLDRWLFASVLLHGAVFTLVVFSPQLFPTLGPNWGSQSGGPVGTSVKIVSNISSGVPLPSPEVVTEDAPANDSPALHKSEPEPAPAPVPDKTAEAIPEPKAPLKKTPPPKAPPKPAAQPSKAAAAPDPPSNAIPAGQGRPSLAYGQFSTGAGDAGIGFGDAGFGDRYSAYVNSIARAISNNWLKSMANVGSQKAPRVYMAFDIGRNGGITNIHMTQSSGIPSLDRTAERAIHASDPLPSLPADYRGSSVSVSFYFEYSR